MNVKIEHISDVLPYISEDKGIIVSKRQDYSVIDYVYVLKDTFDSPVSLQCRGLKFDKEGRIIARPFHKFFNLGEKETEQEVDWSRAHNVLEKLDGSMIHPVLLNGELVFMTRMGITDQSKLAQERIDQNVLDLSRHLLEANITPLFEYTAPDNRIVIQYSDVKVTLLAAREMITGRYLTYSEISKLGQKFEVPVVKTHGSAAEFSNLIDHTRSLEGAEGYVVKFDDGHFVKLKADAYVLRHKALSDLTYEKNVLAWVVEDALDDVIPLLAPELAERVRVYEEQVIKGMEKNVTMIEAFYADHGEKERKEYAEIVMKKVDPRLRGALFAVKDGRAAREFLINDLKRASKSSNRVDNIRDLYDFSWSIEGINLPEE